MTGPSRIVVTVAVFATMLALVVWRPRRYNEAWWTVLGAIAMLGLGLVSPHQAIAATLAGKNALLFLLSLLALSLLIGKSGFFDWAAIHCARTAAGNGRALYRNAYVLGAIVTATLSLDTTAVILTPILLALVKRISVPAAPYILLCAFVANVGSLLLPISNLTNILFADAFHLTFASFAGAMIAPQLVALAVTYALLRWHCRHQIPARFDGGSLAEPASVVPHRAFFLTCVAVLGVVLVGYFLAPLAGIEPYVVAFAGSGVLAIAGVATGRVGIGALGELSWSLFPFVIGLFVAVQGLANLGIVGPAAAWLEHLRAGSPAELAAVAGPAAGAANLMNNLPAALLARQVLLSAHASTGAVLAALVGVDVGPMVTPVGSLATMLVLAIARREGAELPATKYMSFGLWATPAIVLPALLALILRLLVAG